MIESNYYNMVGKCSKALCQTDSLRYVHVYKYLCNIWYFFLKKKNGSNIVWQHTDSDLNSIGTKKFSGQ